MKLVTDHAQWYDAIFDGDGPTLERMAFTRGGLAKREQLALFARLGLATPPHGLVRELAARAAGPFGAAADVIRRGVEVVVYEDEFVHGGRGKRRVSFAEALERWPDHYATLYVPPAGRALNIRHARVGRIGVWIEQVGAAGEWRSNVRDAEEILSVRQHPEPPPIPRVLWAIDFLPSPHGLLAVDFNTAPELATLGESQLVSIEAVRRELEHAAAVAPAHLRQL